MEPKWNEPEWNTPEWNGREPIYRQLRDRIAAMILDEALVEGAALPSVRTVAADTRVNPLTVLKAYQQLADEKLCVEKRRGLGLFVSPGARGRLLETERRRFLDESWPQIRATIRRLGLSAETLLAQSAPASNAEG